jgi:hypothetical protein
MSVIFAVRSHDLKIWGSGKNAFGSGKSAKRSLVRPLGDGKFAQGHADQQRHRSRDIVPDLVA